MSTPTQTSPLRILAIDPGYDRVGIAILEKNPKESVIFSECFTTKASEPFVERLFRVCQEISRVITLYNPTELAIENLFLEKNQKTAMRVSEARGAILYQARAHNLSISEYTPLQIKTATTGYGKATKDQVTLMVQRIIPNTRTISQDDEMDAIAIGITHFAYRGHKNTLTK